MGFGAIGYEGTKVRIIDLGARVLSNKEDHFVRIRNIFDYTLRLIDTYLPDELAIESPFYGKNIQSMLKLGRAQGAAISAALQRSIPIFEYAPRKIKMSITGHGNASKEKVAQFLTSLLHLKKLPDELDATDGLAAAMCHFYEKQNAVGSHKKNSNWADFIKNNPHRVR
ncbi:MAG: crossover junction endodeoxyribonuclease RuvC [Bacteroidetes bacterium]|nr:crossover junction endodeoxyribonuclease RuvC [Bacteroidota bacterium]